MEVAPTPDGAAPGGERRMSWPATHVVRESAHRTWLKTLRRPVPLTFSFVQPLLWMLIFGFLFQRFTLGERFTGLTYLDFLLPGICTMTVLFGASQAGISLVRDLQAGYLQRMVRASTYPGWMLAGKLGADVLRLLVQVVVVALLGVAVGARPSPDFLALLPAMVALTCFAFAYTSLSCWIALKSGVQESMAVFIHVVNMPLLFTSTALVPVRQMPPWLQAIAGWNPLTLVADGLRDALFFQVSPEPRHSIVPLAVLAMLLFVAARRALMRVAGPG